MNRFRIIALMWNSCPIILFANIFSNYTEQIYWNCVIICGLIYIPQYCSARKYRSRLNFENETYDESCIYSDAWPFKFKIDVPVFIIGDQGIEYVLERAVTTPIHPKCARTSFLLFHFNAIHLEDLPFYHTVNLFSYP